MEIDRINNEEILVRLHSNPDVTAAQEWVDELRSQLTGDEKLVRVDLTDLDGDLLIYKWFLDELEEVGTGTSLTLKDVDHGEHKVTVEVTDPSGASSTKDFEFTVNKKSDDNGSPGFGSALVVAAMAIMVVALVARRRP